jgi:hypothetical protein
LKATDARLNDFGLNLTVKRSPYEEDVAPPLPANTMLHIIGIHDNTAA